MGEIIIELLPMILGCAIVPVWLTVNLIILMGARGVVRSAAFIAGVTLVRLLVGVLFGFVFGPSPDSAGGPSPVTSTLLLVVGVLFAISAGKYYLKEPDADEPAPKWMTTVDSLTPGRLFLLGGGWGLLGPKPWIFTLSALSVIREAPLSVSEGVIAYLIYVLGSLVLFLIPLILAAVAPKTAETALGQMRGWLERNNRAIMMVVSAVFAVLFLYKGITGLLG